MDQSSLYTLPSGLFSEIDYKTEQFLWHTVKTGVAHEIVTAMNSILRCKSQFMSNHIYPRYLNS